MLVRAGRFAGVFAVAILLALAVVAVAAGSIAAAQGDAPMAAGGSGTGSFRASTVDASAVDETAGEDSVVIEAEVTEYRYGSHGTIVEARDNVRVTHRDIFVSADYLRVDVEVGELLARGNVLVRRGSSVTSCSLFAYDIKAATGRVLDPKGSVPGVYVRGKEMDVASDKLTLTDAHATGCDLEDPCYRVTTRKLVIYPDQRVVAEWPVLWLEYLPVLVVPRLTIPLRGERVGWVEGEGYPVPRLGYGPENGFVAGLSYLDRSRKDLTIRYDGAYVTRPGGIQVEARADASPREGVSAAVVGGLRSWEGPYASASCRLDITEMLARDGPATFSVLADASYRSGTASDAGLQGGVTGVAELGPLALRAAVRKDLPSTGAVYSIPALDATLGPVAIPGARVTLSGGVGRFEEPGRGAMSTRSYAALSVSSKPLSLTLASDLEVTFGLSGSARRAWYGTGAGVGSLAATVSLDGRFGSLDAFGRDTPRVVAGLDYTRRVVSGASPFAFDEVSPLNQVTADVTARLTQSWTAGVGATYDIDGGAVEDLDFSVTNHHHCYDITARWREKRQEFGLEVRFTR
ncbi:MAG: DUF3769 domain-containing protein [Clostridia bacterium]